MKAIDRILSLDNLRCAWEDVAEKHGAPGRDRVSITRWRRNWEERTFQLAQAVRTNTYRPQRPRIVHIPKKDGTTREIGILNITDRVLQRAVLRVVDDLFEKTFLDCSYGYRMGRSLWDAVSAILGIRDRGLTWVVDADIDACFKSLQHHIILQEFQRTVPDPDLVRLLKLWLQNGNRSVGISMGGVISPLLCNIYLNLLDHAITSAGYSIIRYADDFCLFCHSETDAIDAAYVCECLLAVLKLKYEPGKTRLTNFENGFDFLGVRFEGNTYSFIANDKRIVVEGVYRSELVIDYFPDGYEG